ncbi:MAG: hypothetical protein ABI693_02575 [Bryobacteraceae bacterium]
MAVNINRDDLRKAGNDFTGTTKDLGQALDALKQRASELSKLLDSIENELPDGTFAFDDGGPDATSKTLTGRFNAIGTAFGVLTSTAQDVNAKIGAVQDQLQVAFSLAGKRVPTAGPARPGPSSEPSKFADFLSSVGQAVVDTQKQLDDASRRYLESADRVPTASPTVFRMPKLSGRMQFEVQFDKSKTVNLIFHSDTEKAKTLNRQSVEFDIVAVPAPPDMLIAMQSTVPAVSLVLDPAVRADLAAARDAAPANADNIPKDMDLQRAIIAQVAGPGLTGSAYLVFCTGDGDNDVGTWLLQDKTLQVIYRFGKKNSDNEGVLKKFLAHVADVQQKFLNPGT